MAGRHCAGMDGFPTDLLPRALVSRQDMAKKRWRDKAVLAANNNHNNETEHVSREFSSTMMRRMMPDMHDGTQRRRPSVDLITVDHDAMLRERYIGTECAGGDCAAWWAFNRSAAFGWGLLLVDVITTRKCCFSQTLLPIIMYSIFSSSLKRCFTRGQHGKLRADATYCSENRIGSACVCGGGDIAIVTLKQGPQ